MADATHVQWNFSAGEVAPRFLGRGDFLKYRNALQTCRNWLPLRLGGLTRRTGSVFVAKARYQTKVTRLIEFQFSTDEAYIIEVGDLYMRFFRDDGPLLDSFAITGVDTGANEFTVAGDQSDHIGVGDEITVSGSTGNDGTYTVASVTVSGATTIAVNENVTDPTADGDIIAPTTIATPWPEASLRQLKFTQSADVIFFGHPTIRPKELRRTAGSDSDADTWSLINHPFRDGPYLDHNASSTTLTPSGTTGSVTVTASSTTGINDGQGFLSTDVGRLIRLSNPAADENWGWGEITAVGTTTSITVDVKRDFAQASVATTDWRLGAWSDTTGWPTVPMFHQGALWWGNTDLQPQTVWRSRIGAFNTYRDENFSGDTLDDLGLRFTIDSDQVNAIQWLVSDQRGLLILTNGGEHVMASRGPFDPVTPTNVEVQRQSAVGAHATVPPRNIGTAVLYMQRAGRRLHELAFRFEDDRFRSPHLSILAEHLTLSGVIDSAFQQNPENVLWLPIDSGRLLSLTYERDHDVLAWAFHVMGGSFEQGIPHVEAVASIQKPLTDQLWMVVKRTINGNETRYIEYLHDAFETSPEIMRKHAFFVDSGRTYDGTPETTITGLDHLEGETVDAWADGSPVIGLTVSNGQITLPDAASYVNVGLPYTSNARTMPLVLDERIMGREQRIVKAHLRLFEAMGTIDAGASVDDSDALDAFDLDATNEPLDANNLYSTILSHEVSANWTRYPVYRFRVTGPNPCTVTQAVFEMEVGGA